MNKEERMLGKTISGATAGVDAFTVEVEAHSVAGCPITSGRPPDGAVRESQERVRSALSSSGFYCLRHRTVVNQAPADRRKERRGAGSADRGGTHAGL
jgi:magnesium chelatase family protein